MQCECVDPGCWCRGLCPEDMTHYLYRVDMDDVGGTAFCDLCGDDAFESGLFTDNPDDAEEDE